MRTCMRGSRGICYRRAAGTRDGIPDHPHDIPDHPHDMNIQDYLRSLLVRHSSSSYHPPRQAAIRQVRGNRLRCHDPNRYLLASIHACRSGLPLLNRSTRYRRRDRESGCQTQANTLPARGHRLALSGARPLDSHSACRPSKRNNCHDRSIRPSGR